MDRRERHWYAELWVGTILFVEGNRSAGRRCKTYRQRETDMLDQPSNDAEKSTPGWRFLKFLGYGERPGAGPSKSNTRSRTSKEPEERKHQFATWYIFAAFLGLMAVQFVWLGSLRLRPSRTASSSSCSTRTRSLRCGLERRPSRGP